MNLCCVALRCVAFESLHRPPSSEELEGSHCLFWLDGSRCWFRLVVVGRGVKFCVGLSAAVFLSSCCKRNGTSLRARVYRLCVVSACFSVGIQRLFWCSTSTASRRLRVCATELKKFRKSVTLCGRLRQIVTGGFNDSNAAADHRVGQ